MKRNIIRIARFTLFLGAFALLAGFFGTGDRRPERGFQTANVALADEDADKIETSIQTQTAQIAALEEAERWDDALLQYERLYESGALDPATRIQVRGKFAELRPKVAKNEDPSKANVWRVKAFVVKNLDFSWEENGERRRCRASYTQEEIDRIERGMNGFADFVQDFSDGWLRIDWTLEVVDATLTELTSIDGSYWVGPIETLKILPEIEENSAETIMVFVKTNEERQDTPNDRIPLFCFGGAIGVWDPHTRGATFISFHWETDSAINEPDGEPMTHEWLHSVQWALEERRGWSKGLAGDPDGGRFLNEERDLESADPCYRRNPDKEKSWIMFYKHILQTHTTREMLRDLSLEKKRDGDKE
ncbi:MAG: hypothetical protein IK077_17280 [Thermoguttaceae bacterium]|nr:hypothetical protein [Thermoguttaceae bacterium]